MEAVEEMVEVEGAVVEAADSTNCEYPLCFYFAFALLYLLS